MIKKNIWILGFLLGLSSLPAKAEIKSSFKVSERIEFRRLDPEEGKAAQWFISFFRFKKNLDRSQAHLNYGVFKIDGRFDHLNFGGDSFVVDLSESSQATIAKVQTRYQLFSIWDSIQCANGRIDLIETQPDNYKLRVHSLEDCAVVFND